MNVIYPPGVQNCSLCMLVLVKAVCVFNWTTWLNRRKVHRYDHLTQALSFVCACMYVRVCVCVRVQQKTLHLVFGFFFLLSCQVHLVVYTLRICPKNVTAMHRSLCCVAGRFSVSCSHSVARQYFILYIYIFFLRRPSMCHYFWPYFHM